MPLGSGIALARRMFVFRYVRFVFNVARSSFLPLRAFDRATARQLTDRMRQGLSLEVQNVIGNDDVCV